jgi:hypothetical protein
MFCVPKPRHDPSQRIDDKVIRKIVFIHLISTIIHVCSIDDTLYTPDPHAELPCSTIGTSSNCENGGKKCWQDTNQNGNPELLHSSQNWEFPAAYSGHRPWVIPWYSWNIQTAVVNHTFVSGASQTYINRCHFQVHMIQINAYLKEYMYLYLGCLYKDHYWLLAVEFKTVGPVFLTKYTSLHLGQQFSWKFRTRFLVLQHVSIHNW